MNFNQVILTGVVSKLDKRPDEQYFTLDFDGALCKDHIKVCDWGYADIKDGDTVIVKGKLQSNQKNIDDGYTDDKEWFIMVYGSGTDDVVIKVTK